jgi:prepilin-type processing-associated H-X9-DG protein
MTKNRHRSQQGLTVAEIIALIFVTLVFLMIILPFFLSLFHSHPKARLSSCASNMKQIGLALLSYAQDYDDTLPPVAAMIRLDTIARKQQSSDASSNHPIDRRKYPVPHPLVPFVITPAIFQCPSIKRPSAGVSYLYNDLAAQESVARSANPAVSLLSAESEDRRQNIGHAKSSQQEGEAAVFQNARLIQGVAIGNASLRHDAMKANGSNYLFVDGHVRWTKPEDVFFPARSSDSHSHQDAKTKQILGPNPQSLSGEGLIYQGRVYRATFHLH